MRILVHPLMVSSLPILVHLAPVIHTQKEKGKQVTAFLLKYTVMGKGEKLFHTPLQLKSDYCLVFSDSSMWEFPIDSFFTFGFLLLMILFPT